jgi:Spy/CpxP family protein refolding chaperone
MYPGFISHWKAGRCRDRHAGAGFGAHAGARGSERWEYAMAGEDDPGSFGLGGHFGVRRPLRFLAYRLGLDEAQVGELARILDEIKTERAQAAVDHRRALSAFADAIWGETFDEARARSGAELRTKSGERLREAVVTALGRLHRLLQPAQREKLAYLVRTGTLSF